MDIKLVSKQLKTLNTKKEKLQTELNQINEQISALKKVEDEYKRLEKKQEELLSSLNKSSLADTN